jgi:hypothetical protein
MNLMNLKSAKLRDAETMLACLLKVSKAPYLRERFYLLLTDQAGRQLNGVGVVIAIQLAILDYTREMPAMMSTLMDLQTDDFARAIMPDDEVVSDAKRFHAERVKARSAT